MSKEQLEIKRNKLNLFIDNFCLSSEIVVKAAMEFEELANKTYGIKDSAYWMQRTMKLETLLREVEAYCPEKYKIEIENGIKV